MSQFLLAQGFVLAAVVLIIVHRRVAARWLDLYVARYQRFPERNWITKSDPDPVIEIWRRRRVMAVVPAIATFLIAMFLLVTSRAG